MPNITINGTILLPPDMYWVDEFDWSPIRQQRDTSLTGAALIQTSEPEEGRPLTLKSGRDCAWLTRAQLLALKELQETLPAVPFEVELGDGRTFTALFDSTEQKPIETEAIQPGKEPAAEDSYIATLKLIILEA